MVGVGSDTIVYCEVYTYLLFRVMKEQFVHEGIKRMHKHYVYDMS